MGSAHITTSPFLRGKTSLAQFPTLAVLSHIETQFTAPDIWRQLPEGCTDTEPHLRINLLKLSHLSPYTDSSAVSAQRAACSLEKWNDCPDKGRSLSRCLCCHRNCNAEPSFALRFVCLVYLWARTMFIKKQIIGTLDTRPTKMTVSGG